MDGNLRKYCGSGSIANVAVPDSLSQCNDFSDIVTVTAPDSQRLEAMRQDYYFVNEERKGGKTVWTCLNKEFCDLNIKENFKAFFDWLSIDGVCMVIPYERGGKLKKYGKNGYYCFNLCKKPAQYWICIRKSALPQMGNIILKVPKHLAGRVIGSKGGNVNNIIANLKRNVQIEVVQRRVVTKE